VIAGRQYVGAKVKQIFGNLRRYAKAAGRVFGVDDHQVYVMRSDHMADVLAHNPPSRAPEDVTNE
jgi:hypothetical protein